MSEYKYVGSELELFASAIHWKRYLAEQLGPFLGPTVLEVGAGIGATTRVLCGPKRTRWVCLEPDAALAAKTDEAIRRGDLPACCQSVATTSLPNDERFDTVLYCDVLEHIEDDRGELLQAAARLLPGGYLVVMGPAHAWLFTPFDRHVGHYRRYSARTLEALTPPGLEVVASRYLDSAGLLASLANRVLLRRSMPTASQIAVWDSVLVRASTVLDRMLGYAVGKSILMVWRKVEFTDPHGRGSQRSG